MHRKRGNTGVGRSSEDARMQTGDKRLVKEAVATLPKEGVHSKLAHEHWTVFIVCNCSTTSTGYLLREDYALRCLLYRFGFVLS